MNNEIDFAAKTARQLTDLTRDAIKNIHLDDAAFTEYFKNRVKQLDDDVIAWAIQNYLAKVMEESGILNINNNE